MVDDELQRNVRDAHELIFPDHGEEFNQAFPLMD